jgi:hypothetical protein
MAFEIQGVCYMLSLLNMKKKLGYTFAIFRVGSHVERLLCQCETHIVRIQCVLCVCQIAQLVTTFQIM